MQDKKKALIANLPSSLYLSTGYTQMNNFHPYHISNIYLDRQTIASLSITNDDKQYLVFWWKHIPVGHLFIDGSEKLLQKDYQEKVIRAVKPSIESYYGQRNLIIEDYYRSNNFQDLLEKVLSKYVPADYPEKADVSIIICTRNRAAQLHRCLQSLNKLVCAPKEIIVIDNAPSDDSTKNLVAEYKNVLYYKEPRQGLDIARNTGIRKASSSIVAFFDDDIIAETHCVYEIAKTFEDTDIAAMTGLVLAAELETEAQFLFEKQWSFNRGFIDKKYDTAFYCRTLAEGPPVWVIGAGANMAFRKKALSETGYFDERLDAGAAGCNGDSELWFRILSKGHSITYNPRAVVWHEHRKTIHGLHKQLFSYMRGFTVAALIQQKQNSKAGYYRHLFRELPKWYGKLIIKGFPLYHSQYRTVFSEIKGIISGLLYFQTYKNKPSGS